MKNRKEIGNLIVLPKTTETFSWNQQARSRVRLGYTIDVLSYVRHLVRDKRTMTGTLEQVVIHNDSACPAVATFFEFEE